jgi:hypothetical protein
MALHGPDAAALAREAQAKAAMVARGGTVEKLARAGYAVKGVLYALIGLLALRTALGNGGRATGTEGALRAVAETSFGTVLLALIAAGLVAYALWRFVQAALDPEREGADAGGVVKRLGYAGSGVVYAGLALSAVRLLLDNGDAGGAGTRSWTARLMSQPFGPWLVGLAGVVGIGIGGYQLYRAWKVKFWEHLDTGAMSASAARWAVGVSRFGIAARAVVFALIGVFLVVAALASDPAEARGLDGVLEALRGQPYGPYLLGLAALGLVAYGLYGVVNARYRRIPS